jgi:hypothetical protein
LACVAALLSTGADCDDSKGVGPGTGGAVEIGEVDPGGACGPGAEPSARRYALATFFHAAAAFVPPNGLRATDRGIYVLGGEAASNGALLDDLWLLDLANRAQVEAAGGCPWVLVTTDFSPWSGLSRGAMSFDPTLERLTVITGMVADGPDEVALTTALTVPVDAPLASPDVYDPNSVGTVDFVHLDETSFCPIPSFVGCWDCATGELAEQIAWNPCSRIYADFSVFPEDCPDRWVDADPLCAVAPACQDAASDIPLPGVAQFAAFTHSSGQVSIVGGAAGCRGVCTTVAAYDDLYIAGAPELEDPESGGLTGQVVSHRELAGSGARVTFDPAGAWGSALQTNLAGVRPANWPTGASLGMHHASGVTLGRRYDPATRQWSVVPFGPQAEVDLLVGGNTFQRLSPQWSYVVELDRFDTTCQTPDPPTYLAPAMGEWLQWEDHQPSDDVFSAFTTGLVHDLSSGALVPVNVLPTRPTEDRLWGAGAAAIEHDAFLLAGGGSQANPSGGYDFAIVDFDDNVTQGTEFTLSQGLATPHFGATAVFDPVEEVAYVIGGSSDATIETVAPAGNVEPNLGSVFLTTEVEVSEDVHTNGQTNVLWWDSTSVTGLRVVHRCRGDEGPTFPDVVPGQDPDERSRPLGACWAGFVDVTLASPDTVAGAAAVAPSITSLSNFADLSVDVRSGPSEPWVALRDLDFVSFDSKSHLATLRVHLNRTLTDGQEVELRVRFQQRPWRQLNSVSEVGNVQPGWQRLQLGIAYSTDRRLTVHVGPPVQVLRTTREYAGAAVPAIDFGVAPELRVRAPADYRLVAGGVDGCPGAFSMLEPLTPGAVPQCRTAADVMARNQWGFAVAQLVEPELVLPTTHGTFHVFVDSGAEARLRGVGGAIAAHVGGAGWDGDHDYATDRLGPYPIEHTAMLFVREASVFCGGDIEGDAAALGGFVVVSAFGCSAPHGVGTVLGDTAWKMRAFHESSHQRMIPFGTEPKARWLWTEGVVSTLHSRRYPTSGPRRQNTLGDGVDTLVERQKSNRFVPWSPEDWLLQTPDSQYDSGPYLVEQLVAMAAASPSHHPDVWSALGDQLADAEATAAAADGLWPGPLPGGARFAQPMLTANHVRDWSYALGAAAWYDELIALNRPKLGLPLLGLVDYVAPSVVGGAQVNGSVKVRQVQGDLFGWPIYPQVPYHLGCTRRAANTPAFTTCTVDGVGRVAGTWPSRTSATQATRTLQKVAGIPQAENDAIVGLFANDLLLEGSVPAYGPASRVKWLLRCRPGSTYAACAADTDADGAPNTGDCAPTDAARYPAREVRPGQPGAASEWTPTQVDLNCDNWPTAAFVGN